MTNARANEETEDAGEGGEQPLDDDTAAAVEEAQQVIPKPKPGLTQALNPNPKPSTFNLNSIP